LQDPAELETFPRAFGRAFRLKVVPIDSLRLCESLCASLVRFRCALSALQAFQTLFPVNANVPNLLLREVGCRQSCFPAELAASASFCAVLLSCLPFESFCEQPRDSRSAFLVIARSIPASFADRPGKETGNATIQPTSLLRYDTADVRLGSRACCTPALPKQVFPYNRSLLPFRAERPDIACLNDVVLPTSPP
jgi:hypothetical protein